MMEDTQIGIKSLLIVIYILIILGDSIILFNETIKFLFIHYQLNLWIISENIIYILNRPIYFKGFKRYFNYDICQN